MKLSTLRRSGSKALPGVLGVARVDRRTKALARRLAPGEIAVVDHIDMDLSAAAGLVAAGAVAVVNAAPSISGRYPSLGARELVTNGVILLDDVGSALLAQVPDGAELRIDGDSVYAGEQLLATGNRQDAESVARSMSRSRDGIPGRLEALSANAVEQLRLERDMWLDGSGVPALSRPIQGRQALVVVDAFDFRRDLARLKKYVKDVKPVLIGVGAGADALLAAGHRPDVVLCEGDEVSETALRCGAEVVLKTDQDGRVEPGERVERLGVRHITFPTACPPADAALLLANVNGASLIVTAGMPPGLSEFLDTGRSSMASSFLTRATVGTRMADAKAVAELYRRRAAGWLLFLALLLALVAVGAAIATTPVGQDWWQQIQDWFNQAYDWARGNGG